MPVTGIARGVFVPVTGMARGVLAPPVPPMSTAIMGRGDLCMCMCVCKYMNTLCVCAAMRMAIMGRGDLCMYVYM